MKRVFEYLKRNFGGNTVLTILGLIVTLVVLVGYVWKMITGNDLVGLIMILALAILFALQGLALMLMKNRGSLFPLAVLLFAVAAFGLCVSVTSIVQYCS